MTEPPTTAAAPPPAPPPPAPSPPQLAARTLAPPLAEAGQPRWLVPARVVGLLATLVFVGLGSLSVMAQLVTTRTDSAIGDYGTEVTALAISADTGDVKVRLGSGTRTTVRTVQRFAFGVPVVDAVVQDGTLRLDQSCRRTHWFPLPGNCTVDFEITAPPGVAVRVTSADGDIRVEGATGDLQLRSSVGDVTVLDSRSNNVRVNATAGDVRLAFSQAPQTVSVRAAVGDVRVQVPADEHTYRVRTAKGAGDVRIDDRLQNGRSDRLIDIANGAGDVVVTGR